MGRNQISVALGGLYLPLLGAGEVTRRRDLRIKSILMVADQQSTACDRSSSASEVDILLDVMSMPVSVGRWPKKQVHP